LWASLSETLKSGAVTLATARGPKANTETIIVKNGRRLKVLSVGSFIDSVCCDKGPTV